MGGGQQGSATSTSHSGPPGWLTPDLQAYLSSVGQQVFGGSGTPGGSPLSLPPGLQQQVAPFNPAQTSALSSIAGLTGPAMNLTGLGAGDIAQFASGANAGPNNPYLAAYANAAAQPTIQNYLNAVEPGIQANAEQTGSFGGTGMMTAQSLAQNNLAQGLASQNANIYEPAYQQGQSLQFAAGQQIPASVSSLYNPLQAQYGAGAAQQQQTQAGLNAGTSNALLSAQWPFALLSEYGQALGMGLGTGGTTTSTQPIVGGKL
jgi:hypothetical protein